jgi:hypothetical protein
VPNAAAGTDATLASTASRPNGTCKKPVRGRIHGNVLVNIAGAGIVKADDTQVGANRFSDVAVPVCDAYSGAAFWTGRSDTVSTSAGAATVRSVTIGPPALVYYPALSRLPNNRSFPMRRARRDGR